MLCMRFYLISPQVSSGVRPLPIFSTERMPFQLASWPPRRLVAIWGGGVLLETVLALPLCVLLVRPEPPLVARLRGRDVFGAQRVVLRAKLAPLGRSAPAAIVAAPVPED